jgi:predicted phage replisome organizer
MASNKSQIYYWIKLMTNFFDDESIDYIQSQKNGSDYLSLYLRLLLKTANTGGRLEYKLGDVIVPIDAHKIERDMKFFDIDTVIVALELYKTLGLLKQADDGIWYLPEIEAIVGTETIYAEKKRLYREKQKQLLLPQSEDNVSDNVRQEYRDKSIDIRDKKLDNRVNISSRVEEYDIKEEYDINSISEEDFEKAIASITRHDTLFELKTSHPFTRYLVYARYISGTDIEMLQDANATMERLLVNIFDYEYLQKQIQYFVARWKRMKKEDKKKVANKMAYLQSSIKKNSQQYEYLQSDLYKAKQQAWFDDMEQAKKEAKNLGAEYTTKEKEEFIMDRFFELQAESAERFREEYDVLGRKKSYL